MVTSKVLPEFVYPVAYCIAGVDEVGRGPLVGDVVTAAVILDPEHPIRICFRFSSPDRIGNVLKDQRRLAAIIS